MPMKRNITRGNIAGLFAVLPTPFEATGALDRRLYADMIRSLSGYEFRGLILCGTNGEYFSMRRPDRVAAVEIAREVLGDKGPLLVANSTCLALPDAVSLGRDLVTAGADVLINIPPLGTQLPRRVYLEYWRRLAGGVGDVSLLIYTLASVNQLPPVSVMVETAAAVPTIVGTKEGHNDLARYIELQKQTDMVAIPADDFHWSEYYQNGCHAFMTPTAALLPGLAGQIHRHLLQGDYAAAAPIQAAFVHLWNTLISLPALSEYHLVARVKAVCQLAGIFYPGHAAPPIIDLPPAALPELARAIAEVLAMERKS
jgi:dihydrodipicolinate synthase/N-acetylneuraminate lyase